MGGGYISIKASSGGYDKNPEKGLPIGMNTVMLFEADTSALVCILDGTWITGCRTGRGRRHLGQVPGRQNVKKLCVIGAGRQARRQLLAITRVRNFEESPFGTPSPSS